MTFFRRPLSLFCAIFGGIFSLLLGIYLDSVFYSLSGWSFWNVIRHPTITPWNNFVYNVNPANLAEHGLHPYYQHLVANLSQLLGPAYLLVFSSSRLGTCFISAITGVLILSVFRHQEARFLIPAVPLFLSSIEFPRRFRRQWIVAWVVFNIVMGIFMGTYHQGGIVPTQNFLARQENVTEALWWRTYNPPTWLLDGRNAHMKTTVLMGMQPESMVRKLEQAASCGASGHATKHETLLVAPDSSTFLDRFTRKNESRPLRLKRIWHHKNHLNLDDLDISTEGLWGTFERVIGRRGLTTWRVIRQCP